MTGAAQEATPPAPNLTAGELSPLGEPFEVGPGTTIEFLNEGQPAAAPGQSLILYRVTFQPGSLFPSHIHPGSTLLTVEEGTLQWTLLAGTVWVTRPGEATEAVTEPGTELVLTPGEGLFYNADVIHTSAPAGDTGTTILITSLFEAGQPVVTLTDEHGTPVA